MSHRACAGLLILDDLSDAKAGVTTLGLFVKSIVGEVAKLAARIPSSYVVPVFIWIIVTFRAADLTWLARASSHTESPSGK